MTAPQPSVPQPPPIAPAVEEGLWSGGGLRRLVGLGDQVLSGLSNFLTVALVARSTSPDGFGRFSLGYAVLLTVLTLVRGVWGTPISLSATPAAALEIARGVLGAVLLATPVIVLIVVAPPLLLDGGSSWKLLLVIAVAAPLVCAQDLCRFAAISAERPWVAVASDLTWVCFVIVGYLLRPSDIAAVAIWAIGAVIGLVVAAVPLRLLPSLRAGRQVVRKWHATGVGIAASNIALLVGTYVVLALATVVVGADAAGALRGASSVMAPVNTLLGFLAIGLLPLVHRAARQRQVGLLLRISVVLVVATGAWSAVLLVIPPDVGELMLGETWALARDVLPWTAVEYLALAVGASAMLGLQARDAGALLIKLGVGAAVLLSGAAVVVSFGAASALPFAIGQAVGAALGAAVWWIVLLRWKPRSNS